MAGTPLQCAPMTSETARCPEHIHTLRVYYQDTDTAGVVYHANYLAFCEQARTEWLRGHGYSQQRLFHEHTAFAVRDLSCRFYAPAHLDDLLEVRSHISRHSRARIVFEQTIWRGDKKLFAATVTVFCLNMQTRAPMAFPSDFLSLLATETQPSS